MKMGIDLDTKIERWKEKAEYFLQNNIKCFLKTIDGGFYSADILIVGDRFILIEDFIKNRKVKIYWWDVLLFEEYKGGGRG